MSGSCTPNTASTLLRSGPAAGNAAARPRLDSLDWLRGLVMVLMALDHARDFLAAGHFNPRDVSHTSLFLTRWVTHFCAPTFVFLAGLSAYLYGARGRSRSQLSGFLLTRGLWLMLLELTVIRFAWAFNWQPDYYVVQVIWAIGVSLLVLSAVVWFPRPAIVVFAILVVAGHNLLDRVTSQQMGASGWLWMLLHEQGEVVVNGKLTLFVVYPMIPWFGVMAAGYALGPALRASPAKRRRWTLGLGTVLIGLFVVLRALNVYGDPQRWSPQPTLVATVLSFVNCEKYPPSLLYLCMTLGPALVLLWAAEGFTGRVASILITFGRVPFLFYAAHIFLLHSMGVAWALLHDGNAAWLFSIRPIVNKPPEYGLSLPMVYVLWLVAVSILYPLCHWFAELKQRRRDWWLSYF
jgi:uncharacterized membrane protein